MASAPSELNNAVSKEGSTYSKGFYWDGTKYVSNPAHGLNSAVAAPQGSVKFTSGGNATTPN